jgi:haloalkane dehalogenase
MVGDVQHAAGLAYRAAGDAENGVALLLHGYPESSYMWRAVLPTLAGAGWRAIAPDLPGYGDSEPDPPGTWERHILALERFLAALDVKRLALITHDWGALIGLRWACEHPDSITALVISNNGGFFTERGHHELARAMRTPGKGEHLIRSYTREAFGETLRDWSPGMSQEAIEEYWKAFADDTRRLGQLDLYRSADFSKLAPYEGCVSRLGVPALILWGGRDPTAEISVAERFHRELPGSALAVIEEAGHFVWEDAPDASTRAVTEFLARQAASDQVR